MQKEHHTSLHSVRQEKGAACNDRPGRAGEKKEASDEAGLTTPPPTHHDWVLNRPAPGPESYLLVHQRLGGVERAKLDQLLSSALQL